MSKDRVVRQNTDNWKKGQTAQEQPNKGITVKCQQMGYNQIIVTKTEWKFIEPPPPPHKNGRYCSVFSSCSVVSPEPPVIST